MNTALRLCIVLTTFSVVPCVAAEHTQIQYLKFPVADAVALGQIDKLVVKVSCSWIADLKNVPELYNISMGYEIPTENELEATPRLGAAAVTLSRWSGVIGVRVPSDADSKSCFNVTVTVRDGEGVDRQWTGSQLGLLK